MRQAIANLIEVARLSFNAKAPASPASPIKPPAGHTARQFQPEPAQPRLKDPITMNTAFIRSPLVDAEHLSLAAVDAILTVYADGDVQRQAAAVRAKLLHLTEFAALRCEIASAVKAVGMHSNDGLTPAAACEVLRQRAADLDDMLEDARAERAAHEAARKARMACTEPLRREVSKRLSGLIAERESCLMRLDAHRRAQTLGLASNGRYHALLAAGVKAEQIAGLDIQDPEQQAAELSARAVAIGKEIQPLTRYTAGGDVADLAGLGMEALIEAAYPDRVAAEVAA